jgi:hypothetical protein
MKGVLTIRNGQRWVLYSVTEECEPFKTYMWWRVLSVQHSPPSAEPAGVPVTWDGIAQHWVGPGGMTVSTGPGDTKAEKIERVSVSCPKVRRGIATRWHRGRWEKLLKRGWVEVT